MVSLGESVRALCLAALGTYDDAASQNGMRLRLVDQFSHPRTFHELVLRFGSSRINSLVRVLSGKGDEAHNIVAAASVLKEWEGLVFRGSEVAASEVDWDRMTWDAAIRARLKDKAAELLHEKILRELKRRAEKVRKVTKRSETLERLDTRQRKVREAYFGNDADPWVNIPMIVPPAEDDAVVDLTAAFMERLGYEAEDEDAA